MHKNIADIITPADILDSCRKVSSAVATVTTIALQIDEDMQLLIASGEASVEDQIKAQDLMRCMLCTCQALDLTHDRLMEKYRDAVRKSI